MQLSSTCPIVYVMSLMCSRDIGREGGFLARDLYGMGYLRFRTRIFNRTHFRTCGRFWLSSVQRARRVAEKGKKERNKKERRIGGKA